MKILEYPGPISGWSLSKGLLFKIIISSINKLEVTSLFLTLHSKITLRKYLGPLKEYFSNKKKLLLLHFLWKGKCALDLQQ